LLTKSFFVKKPGRASFPSNILYPPFYTGTCIFH